MQRIPIINKIQVNKGELKRQISPKVSTFEQSLKQTLYNFRKSCINYTNEPIEKVSSTFLCEQRKSIAKKRTDIQNQKEMKTSQIMRYGSSQNLKEFKEKMKRRSLSSVFSQICKNTKEDKKLTARPIDYKNVVKL